MRIDDALVQASMNGSKVLIGQQVRLTMLHATYLTASQGMHTGSL